MNRILLLFAALAIAVSVDAQSPSWLWAHTAINRGAVSNIRICVDGDGNTYSIGSFTNTIQFPDTTYDANSSNGTKGLYLAKYNKDGLYQWARLLARTNYLTPTDVAADSTGNVYIGGAFGSNAHNYGTIQLPDTTLATTGYQDAFLMKYNNAGQYQWVKIYGGSLNEVITTISTDRSSNLILAGYFDDSVMAIDGHALSHPKVNSNYGPEFFIAKYDALGRIIWANQGKGVSDYAFKSAVDRSGNIYVAGAFHYTTSFDTIKVQYISSGFVVADNFVAKYDSNGKAIWARVIGGSGGSGHDGGSVTLDLLAVDTAGNAYISGSHDLSSVLFENSSKAFISRNAGKFWYGKYSPSGQILWANATDAGIGSIGCDEPGNLYVVGAYTGDATFDTIQLHGLLDGPAYAFVAKYSLGNSLSWLQSVGSVGDAGIGFSCIVSKDANAKELFLSGVVYRGSYVMLGSSSVYNHNSPGSNAFVAKMGLASAEVRNLPGNKNVLIYPIPASTIIHVHQYQNEQYQHYELSNDVGQIIKTGKLQDLQDQAIELSAMRAGLYYLKLLGKQGTFSSKLLVRQ
jgi:hypothetical protein